MATGTNPSAGGTPPATPWWASPLFHYLTAVTAGVLALLGLKFGIPPELCDGAFGAAISFLGVGVGVSASSPTTGSA